MGRSAGRSTYAASVVWPHRFLPGHAVWLVLAVNHKLGLGASVLFLGLMIALKRPAEEYIDRTLLWGRGARAEEAVGETLNELRRDGWM